MDSKLEKSKDSYTGYRPRDRAPDVPRSYQSFLRSRTSRSPRVLDLLARFEALKMPHSSETDTGGRKTPFRSYGQWAQEIGPRVRDALAGKLEVPPQAPSTEAWLTYALYWARSQLSLEDIIHFADVVGHSIPNADEIAWTLLRLNRRKWLSLRNDSYGLTAQGRLVVDSVTGKGNLRENIERLKQWTVAHPPPNAE